MIGETASRAAVMAWRDEAAMSAMALVHDSSASAMRMLETQLDAIAVADAVWNAEAAARAVVRPAMRAKAAAAANRWFNEHAQALRQVDARLELLALRFAAMGERPALPLEDAAPAVPWSAPAWLRGSVDALGSAIERAAGEVSERAVPDAIRASAERLSSRVAHEIGARCGAHERLRAGGRSELTGAWLGIASEDGITGSYLTKLLDFVDCAAAQAKEILR